MDIQTLLDKEEIRELRYAFAWNLETSQPDALADLFTADGVIDVGPWGRMDGQDAIRRGYGKAYRGMPAFTAMHAVTNGRIQLNGDDATGTWYLLDLSLREANTNPLEIVAIYDEIYRRTPEGWRMKQLKLNFLWSREHGRITADNPMAIPRKVREGHSAEQQKMRDADTAA